MKKDNVDWSEYAKQYDLLLSNHPPYQELLKFCLEQVSKWQPNKGFSIADFGGGTGNLSILIAERFPLCNIIHLDFNESMLALAEQKAKSKGLSNWEFKKIDLEDKSTWGIEAIDAAISVNAIYSLNNPKKAIENIIHIIRPGGYLLFSDVGREMDIADWSYYLITNSIREKGLIETVRLILKTRIAKNENAKIRKNQQSGRYWLHSLKEFEREVKNNKISITYSTDSFYRGYNDTVVGIKSR